MIHVLHVDLRQDHCTHIHTHIHRYVVEVLLDQKGLEARMQNQFVAQQLFSMFSVLDLSDEVGRCVYVPRLS